MHPTLSLGRGGSQLHAQGTIGEGRVHLSHGAHAHVLIQTEQSKAEARQRRHGERALGYGMNRMSNRCTYQTTLNRAGMGSDRPR